MTLVMESGHWLLVDKYMNSEHCAINRVFWLSIEYSGSPLNILAVELAFAVRVLDT